jgi:hypothetical protein
MIILRRASVAIIGGGIGGLTATTLLLRAGFDVQVYEQAWALEEVGAGIRIGPNASRILHRLGIAEVLGRTGLKPATFDQRRWDDGRILLRSPLGETIESIRRAVLHFPSGRSSSRTCRCNPTRTCASRALLHTSGKSPRPRRSAFRKWDVDFSRRAHWSGRNSFGWAPSLVWSGKPHAIFARPLPLGCDPVTPRRSALRRITDPAPRPADIATTGEASKSKGCWRRNSQCRRPLYSQQIYLPQKFEQAHETQSRFPQTFGLDC